MLLANIPNGNLPAVDVHNGVAEEPFGQKDALGMVAEGPMTKVCDLSFRLIEEVVDGLVVFGLAAEPPCALDFAYSIGWAINAPPECDNGLPSKAKLKSVRRVPRFAYRMQLFSVRTGVSTDAAVFGEQGIEESVERAGAVMDAAAGFGKSAAQLVEFFFGACQFVGDVERREHGDAEGIDGLAL
jgi:hypothetical protein